MKLYWLIHKWMVRYLRKHGWVVFYLDEEYRTCSDPNCWINLYAREMKKEAPDDPNS